MSRVLFLKRPGETGPIQSVEVPYALPAPGVCQNQAVNRQQSVIMMKNGEGWWGGLAADGVHMPFGKRPWARDLAHDHLFNQAAPLLISDLGRVVWSEAPFHFQFDGATLTVDHTCPLFVSEEQTTLRGAYLQATHTFFPFSGRLPDERLFTAPQYNTWIELLYEPTQEKVLEYAHGVLDNGFPAGVLMIDDNWMEDYGRWHFHPGRFPDPRAMTTQLSALGFPVMVWVCPFVSPDGESFLDLERRGLLLKDATGATAIRRWWNGHSAVLDLSCPAAVAWFTDQLELLQTTAGVAGFKFDAGDPAFYRDDDLYHDSSSPTDQCRRWSEIGLNFPLSEFRASWKMGGQALAQRQRDKAHAWTTESPAHGGTTGLNTLIPDGLAQGLLGYPYSCPDMVGGGEYLSFTLPTPERFDQELFVRSAQAAALMPMMQFSAAPWRLLDTPHLDACREAAWQHVQHADQLLHLAHHAAQTGEPIMRTMAYVFPAAGLAAVYDQFLLGDDLLVAPVLDRGATSRSVLLPPGRWEDESGSVHDGGQVLTVAVTLHTLPTFRRLQAPQTPV